MVHRVVFKKAMKQTFTSAGSLFEQKSKKEILYNVYPCFFACHIAKKGSILIASFLFLQSKKFLVANETQDIISAHLILLRCESDREKSENYTTAKITGYTV